MSRLALLGGTPTRTAPFPPYPVLLNEEKEAVLEVLAEGRLSTFIASPGEHFLGGARIRRFEQEFAAYHGVKFAVAFNSATAALHAAVAATGVQPGEEVVTTPYTFTSTATCALMHNAVPVFADVDARCFCLDPESLRDAISPLTRAVIPVHLFGQPADMDGILAISRERGLRVIEDCAQAPGARYRGRLVGTLGDCGVFSFQETKNMMTGEGGMLITNDEDITEIARLVRNHGEAVVHTMERRTYASELLGYNYRMTEFEAAIGRVQLGRLEEANAHRIRLAEYLSDRIGRLPGIHPARVRESCRHVYYVFPFLYEECKTGISREDFARALKAEGIPVGTGYVRPLYLSPLFQERRAFAFRHYRGSARYLAGSCPVAESLHFRQLLCLGVVRPPATERDMDDIVCAMEKVLAARDEFLAHA